MKDPTQIARMNANQRDTFLTKQEKSDYQDWLMRKRANEIGRTLKMEKGVKGKKGGGKVGMQKGGLARRKRK